MIDKGMQDSNSIQGLFVLIINETETLIYS